MTQHIGTLTLDGREGYVEAPAIYDLAATWVQGDVIVTGCRLASWIFDGRQQTRETAVALIGEDAVVEHEARAARDWKATARRDMADDRADSRHWLAAE